MGKSESIKITCAFLIVFGRLWLKVKMERFTIVLASHDKKSVKKLFKEIKPYIYKAIELFNKTFPNSPLLYKEDDRNLEDNDIKIEINRQFGDEIVAYAQMFAITAQGTNDSLSANLIIADESGIIDEQSFETSVTPFTTTTNGLLSMIGLPTHDNSTLLFQNYLNPNVIKTKYTWEDIYKMRLLTDVEMAEGYKLDFTNRSRGKERSSYIRWNYYCDFEDSNGKFITKKFLEESNIMNQSFRNPETKKDNWVVMGVDIAPKHDYFSVIIGESKLNDSDDIVTDIVYMKTVNKNRERVDKDSKINAMLEACIKYKVDILCIDSTSQGLWFVQDLVKAFKTKHCRTQIFPYSYAGANKEALFSYLESSLFSLKCNLLTEDECWESEKLVEELTYLIKEKSSKSGDKIEYYAPKGDHFSDDHVNSLALTVMAYKYAYDCDLNRKKFDDGQNTWRPRLRKNNTEGVYEDNNADTENCGVWLKVR